MENIRSMALALSLAATAALVSSILGWRIPTIILTALLLALLAAMGYLIHAQVRIQTFLVKENRELKASRKWSDEDIARLNQMRTRSELSVLQFQINPHFLYNTLDTIRAQALISDQADIAQMAERLARFFRHAISNRESIVKVEEEIRHIEDYLYIQKKRFGNRFEAQIVLESPELNEYYIPKLMLQPLVENAITHGLEKLKSGGIVRVTIGTTEQKLIVWVEDNGVGMSQDQLRILNERLRTTAVDIPAKSTRGNGIAVQNVDARIRMIFGEEWGLHYRSQLGEGTQVVATLPLVDDFERAKIKARVVGLAD